MSYKHFFLAAIYSAATVAGSIFMYSGYAPFRGLVGMAVFIGIFTYALTLSLFFYIARWYLSEISYFLMHLLVGLGIGVLRVSSTSYEPSWEHYLFSPEALFPTLAAMSAWLYIFIFTSPQSSKKTFERSEKWKGYMSLLLFLNFFIAPVPPPPPLFQSSSSEDSSCHNVFRGERTRVSPSLMFHFRKQDYSQIELDLFKSEISEFYDGFAAEYGLSIQGHPIHEDSTQRNICNDSIIIRSGGTFSQGWHSVSVFEHVGASDWEFMISDFVCRIEQKWDGRIYFKEGGEEIPKPEFLIQECAEINEL